MSKKLNREIKCIDHLEGHKKRQGFAHYTDRDIRVLCTERSQPVKVIGFNCFYGIVVCFVCVCVCVCVLRQKPKKLQSEIDLIYSITYKQYVSILRLTCVLIMYACSLCLIRVLAVDIKKQGSLLP